MNTTKSKANRHTIGSDVINKLNNYGFKVWMRDINDCYLYFEDESGNIGYLQHGYFEGFSISSVHIPNRGTGTGFQIAKDLEFDDLEQEVLESCFIEAPYWASSGQISSVRKWKNFEQLRNSSNFNSKYFAIDVDRKKGL